MEGSFSLYIVCVFTYLTFNVVILRCNVFAEKVEGRLDLCTYISVAVRQVDFPDVVRTI